MINLFQTQDNQTKLTPKKLNQEIKLFVEEKAILKSTENQVWDKKVFIDLSKIEWINTSALVELILIIENLIEDGIMVTVALPNRNMLSSETQHLKNKPEHKRLIEYAIEQRRAAREWLYRLKIIKALSFEHQPDDIRSNIKVLDIFDKVLFEQNPAEEESDYYKIHGAMDAEQEYLGEKYHVPLLWTKGYNYHSDNIINILKSCLDISHAQIISDIVINELSKNVKDHSTKKHGLFCAVAGKHNPDKVFGTDYYKDDMPFFKSCNGGEYIIEIVFGDSGDGIINKLKNFGDGRTGVDLLRYSFDKWSTRFPYEDDYKSFIKRGTRGLYHVRRVVQNYDGMVAIRTNNFYAGFNDLTNEDIDETKLQEFNGTLLTLRLLPGRGKTLKGRYYPTTQSAAKNASKCERLSIDVNNFSEGLKRVGEESKKNSYKNFLISLDFSKFLNEKSSDETVLNAQLRKLLASLSNLRHPNVHIIYGFPAGFKDTRIEAIVNGVNEAIKLQRERNKHLVFDPIMIIGPMGSVHWAGVKEPKLVSFLNKLMETEELSLPIETINQEENKKLIAYIKQDTELFSLQNGSIKLNFNKNAPIEYFKKKIQKRIKDLVKDGDQKRRILVTPNLKYVKGWFDIREIYENLKNEYALSLYSLWHNHRFKIFKTLFPDRLLKKEKKQGCSNEALDNIQRDLLKDNLKILVGSQIDIPLGEMFLHLLDIRNQSNLIILSDEEDSKKPRRNRLFDEDDYVIIITSVVSTAETAKKLIKSVLRSNATPVCLLSLADFSGEDQKPIEQWGNPILFYPIITNKNLLASEPQKNIDYKSIIGNENEKPLQNNTFYVEDELRGMILNSKSLHFSHIGKSNGRHFTFYFNAKRFLKIASDPDKSISTNNIWKKFEPIIYKWYKKISSSKPDEFTNSIRGKIYTSEELSSALSQSKDQLYIWHPGPEYKKGYQGQGLDLSDIIQKGIRKNSFFKFIIPESISRDDVGITEIVEYPLADKNLIIVDWGSITGESIEKLIYKANRYEFKNILVCVFLNQLPENKKNYLKSISNITSKFSLYEKEKIPIEPKGQLPLDYEPKKPTRELLGKYQFSSNIQIEFIYNFLLTCYESDYECNVCALREDLEKYEIPNAILEKYAKNRRRVLDIRPREITKYEPFDFYSRSYDEKDEKNIPLDEEFILRMFEFKTLLMNAQISSYWRLRTKLEFVGILKSLIDYKGTERINKSSEKENEIWVKIIKDCTDITNQFKLMLPEMYNSIKVHDFNIDSMFSRTHAMLYFLSVETAWIQKPPLSNLELRQMLSLISRAIIFNNNLKLSTKNGKKNTDVVRIKYAAITVLRMADKNDFIKNIFAILKNTQIEDVGSNSIIENILFHTNTFISKDYHFKHSELDEVKSELDKAENLFNKEKDNKYLLIREANISLKLNIDNLIIRGQVRKLKLVDLVKSCLSDIEKGIEKVNYDHPALIQNFRDLEVRREYTIEEIDLGKKDYFIKSFNKNWLYVSGFIKNIIGVYLNEIKEILDPDWGSPKGFNRLKPYLFIKNFGIDDTFSLLIRQINDSKLNLTKKSFIKTYKEEYKNIRDIFISDPRYDGKKSVVFDILEKLHGDLMVSLDYAITKYSPSQILFKTINSVKDKVFYPQDLLDELIIHLFKNGVEKKIENTMPEVVFKSTRTANGYILLDVTYKNTRSDINRGSGTGLRKHKEYILKFNGEMLYDPNKIRDFSVKIKLRKYE